MNKKGKLIVIEGTDGSGKKTQTAKLLERLLAHGAEFSSGNSALFQPHGIDAEIDSETEPQVDIHDTQTQIQENTQTPQISSFVETIDFPRYGTPSCYLVEKYLHGGFGTAQEVGPYIASMFYAVDRYDHSFLMKKKLEEGTLLVSDRYVSASMGHQAGKIDDIQKRDEYLEWLHHLEYEIFGIPKPDITILLYVDPMTNQLLMSKRPDKEYLKGKKADIHEADLEHLRKASEAFLYVAQKFGWIVIDCAPKTETCSEGSLLSIDDIHEKIWNEVSKII